MNEQTLNMLNVFKAFMKDSKEDSMYVTGAAGTGKTTDLVHLVDYCADNNIRAVVCAYTHKAVGVLREKMPARADLRTLHAFLGKCPTVNIHATKVDHIDGNSKGSSRDVIDVLFIDEFSMVGERDYVDIGDLQTDDNGNLATKVVFLGDLNQLPPVKDMQTIVPGGPYYVNLTKVYRQADDNPLLDTLTTLVSYIQGAPAAPLVEHKTFKRGVDLVKTFKEHDDCILLAYTNKTVQRLNAEIAGYDKPRRGDVLYSPTTKQTMVFHDVVDKPDSILDIRYDIIERGSTFKTLEKLEQLDDVEFYNVDTDEDVVVACVFGHQNYIDIRKSLADEATRLNRIIEKTYKMSAVLWCRDNYNSKQAKERNMAWGNFLSFNSSVLCIDFSFAMTVHKSQGSTFKTVLIDTEDLGICADKNYKMYLKLLYVALSRASERVYTN